MSIRDNGSPPLYGEGIILSSGNKTYSLIVSIRDNGSPPLYGEEMAIVRISIADKNDHSPHFVMNVFEGYVVENTTEFVPPFRVNATDHDDGECVQLRYNLGPFKVEISKMVRKIHFFTYLVVFGLFIF